MCCRLVRRAARHRALSIAFGLGQRQLRAGSTVVRSTRESCTNGFEFFCRDFRGLYVWECKVKDPTLRQPRMWFIMQR